MTAPQQPFERDFFGVVRFRSNPLVSYLLAAGGLDLNDLALLPNIHPDDWAQFAQLLGYDLGKYGELTYVSNEMYNMALEARDEFIDAEAMPEDRS